MDEHKGEGRAAEDDRGGNGKLSAVYPAKGITLPRKILLGRGARVRAETIRFLKTSIEYLGSEAIYDNPQVYRDFIGDEVEECAAFGRQIALLVANKNPRVFLETCSGPGTVVRDIIKDFPGCAFVCADLADAMVSEGQRINPHLGFVKADITRRTMIDQVVAEANRMLGHDPDRATTIDVAFNSASSLGFMEADQLDQHLAIMHDLLNPDGGQYFADNGYYSSVGASWITNQNLWKGQFAGAPAWDWTVTVRYFPLTDMHEITWSSWTTGDPSQLLFAASHRCRAYRASELAHMARNRGLGFRLWRWEDKGGCVSFEEIGPDFCFQFEDEHTHSMVCEFYRGSGASATRLDRGGKV